MLKPGHVLPPFEPMIKSAKRSEASLSDGLGPVNTRPVAVGAVRSIRSGVTAHGFEIFTLFAKPSRREAAGWQA